MKNTINWTNIFKKYKGLWVALDKDEKTVISSSENAKEAYEEAIKKGIKVPIMLNVPLEPNSFVGGSF